MQKFIWQKGNEQIEIGKFSKFIFSGFDFGGDVSRQTEAFSGIDGERIVNSVFKSRTITINGYIMATSVSNRFELRREFFRMFDGKTAGLLHYRNNNGSWRINAVPRLPALGAAVGRKNVPFVLYFDCPDFYFEEEKENILPLYQRQNMLSTPLTFPCVFTKRTMTQNVINNGSFKTLPIIEISTYKENDKVQTLEIDAYITIVWGRGKTFKLNYVPTVNEVITIDSGALTVTSDINGDLIACITDESEFLELMPGSNEISILNNTTSEIVAYIKWHNREAGL